MSNESVFQVDSELVNSVYSNHDNFLIEYSSKKAKSNQEYCALYFSSNNIYFPNNEEMFGKAIVEGNRFEWYGTRFEKATKHVFIRDVHKQWYLTGIQAKINDPGKLLEFLKKETDGYKILTVGSSSGGFAAVLFGQLLNAQQIYTFNGQFEVNSLLQKSSESVDPILFRNKNNPALKKYYDIKGFIKDPLKILYFRSNKSDWDVEQHDHIKDLGINTFSFNTDHHGIPFAKTALNNLINRKVSELNKFRGKNLHPLTFSLRVGGLKQTFNAVLPIVGKLMKIGTRD